MSTNYIVMAFNYRPNLDLRHVLIPQQLPILEHIDKGWFIYKYEPPERLLICTNPGTGTCVLVAPLEQDKSLDVVAIELLIDKEFFPNIHRRLKTHAKR